MNDGWRVTWEKSVYICCCPFLLDMEIGKQAGCMVLGGAWKSTVVGITCSDCPDIWGTSVRIYCIARVAIASFGCAKHEVDQCIHT